MDNYLSSHTGPQIDNFDNRINAFDDALDSKLPLVGGIISGQIQKAGIGIVGWHLGRDNALIRNTSNTQTNNSYNCLISNKSKNGTWDIGTSTANNSLYFSYITDNNYSSNTNATGAQVEFRGSDNTVRANKFVGTLEGNATNVSGTIAIAHGGTGSTSADAAKKALGIPKILRGRITTSNGSIALTFPSAFASAPIVITSAHGTGTQDFSTHAGATTATGCTIYATSQSASNAVTQASIPVNWIAVGDWP